MLSKLPKMQPFRFQLEAIAPLATGIAMMHFDCKVHSPSVTVRKLAQSVWQCKQSTWGLQPSAIVEKGAHPQYESQSSNRTNNLELLESKDGRLRLLRNPQRILR
jgi:hypothetical protein